MSGLGYRGIRALTYRAPGYEPLVSSGTPRLVLADGAMNIPNLAEVAAERTIEERGRRTAAPLISPSARAPFPGQVRFLPVADSRWWRDLDEVIAAAVPAGSRVLDVGCGDGGLVDRLVELGFDAVGVDPAAPARPRVIGEPVEHVRSAGPFDAAVAVMALHHAELDAVTRALARLLRPQGKLFVYDFDWVAYDDRAVAWLARHDRSGADNSVAGWQREHGGLHAGAAIRQSLAARFEPLREVSRPYLARMLARRDLEAVEHALIDTQMLPQLGFWVIAERPG